MKTSFLSALLTLVLFTTGLRAAAPVEVHIGVSPFLTSEQRQAFGRELPNLLLDSAALPTGSRVVIWDAWGLRIVTDLAIPALKFDTQQARATHLAKSFVEIGQWVRSAPQLESGVPPTLFALKTPELLELISREPSTLRRSVLLLGSPLYLNLTEPTFSMTEARYPGDGHLLAPVSESVFGLAEKTNRLAGTTVHWCFFTEQLWQTELHRTAVTRFWGLFMQGQKGILATFGADLPSALANSVRVGMSPCGRFVLDSESDKVEMRTAAPRAIPVWLEKARTETPKAPAIPVAEKPLTQIVEPAPQREVVVAVPAPAPTPAPVNPVPAVATPAETPAPVAVTSVPIIENNPLPVKPGNNTVGIGIIWAVEGVDLDLYVRAGPGKHELSYRNTTSREGRYYRDYRNRNADLEYEYVELTPTTNMKEVTAWVNYYKGRAAGVAGQLCVHYQGRSYVGQFRLAASSGNHGADSAKRAASPYWTQIKLTEIVGLGPKQ